MPSAVDPAALSRSTRAQILFAACACVMVLSACGGSGGDAPPLPTSDAGPERRCAPPPGVSGSPGTIDEALTLIDALPAPVTLPCFLESLDRPLKIELTNSIFSAQPAAGRRSPRIFVFSGDLVMSIVPDGRGAEVLEFGEFVDEDRTRKGELAFPIATPVPRDAPYEHVRSTTTATGTTCGACHAETRDPAIDFAEAYVSIAFRPRDQDLVRLVDLQAERAACDFTAEPDRCAVLEALLGHGTVAHLSFPDTLRTFH